MDRKKAWDYAFGLIKVDGLKPTDDFVEMAKKEIRGELTLADIEKSLNVKYKIL
ncbi:hypothetical protein R83H12_00841 [Fibrobacteria bacterium R8-3-H12]